MPEIFSIDPKRNHVVLGQDRTGEMRFTVTNASSEELRGHVRTKALEPCEAAWLVTDRDSAAFQPGQAQEFSVAVRVPDAVDPGTYSFRLEAASERNPDHEKTAGPSVSFEVPVKPNGGGKWKDYWWVPLVVLLAGVLVWVVARALDGSPPDFDGEWRRNQAGAGLQSVTVIEKADPDGGDPRYSVVATYDDRCVCKPCDLVATDEAELRGETLAIQWSDESADLYHTLELTLEEAPADTDRRSMLARYEVENARDPSTSPPPEVVVLTSGDSRSRDTANLAARIQEFDRQTLSAAAAGWRLALMREIQVSGAGSVDSSDCAGASPPPPPPPPPPAVPRLRGDYRIQHKLNSRYVDAHTSGDRDFGLVTRTFQSNNSQVWTFTPQGGQNEYRIQHKTNGRYVDAHTSQDRDFHLVTRGFQPNNSQIWVVTRAGSGTRDYHIRHKTNMRYVDGHEDAGHDFRLVTRNAQHNTTQVWTLTPAGNN